jgi:hypothetical protein
MNKLKLPVAQVPYYTATLPVSGITTKYRPFVVKEEKILLVALQSQDSQQISDAMSSIISLCTNGNIDTYKICSADAEYIFLQIRAKSIGEEAKPQVMCGKCQTQTSLKVRLDEVALKTSTPKSDTTIKLDDDVSLIMRYANIHDLDTNKSPVEAAFDLAKQCVEAVIIGEDVVTRTEIDDADLGNFIDNLTPKGFEQIMDFFETTPKLNYGIEYTCPKCREKVKVEFKSITDFFR